ncbi:MAG TPA: hypothetical protein VME47_06015 [Acetobacteraceae bacterium]|nr:hypothetical protein [Acetobacteraceae bacterium]
MRKTLLAAAIAFVVGGASVGSLLTYAQPAPPPPAADGRPGAPGPHPGMAGPGWCRPMGPMGWMHRGQWHHHPLWGGGPFALVYRQKDLNLSPSDVQTIVEGFLLRHGNHTWKVVNVGPAADGQVGFALATKEGSVIATFTMDPHSGRVQRTG